MSKLKIETNHIKTGAKAGLIGGIVFGAMMGAMGALPMIAALMGSDSGTFGFLIHVVISIAFGAIFALFFGHAAKHDELKAITLGIISGFIFWILGPLFIMPIWLGMGPQLDLAGVTMAIPSLWGHIIYGFILGLVYFFASEQEVGNK